MKITKKQLYKIIREELNEVYGAYRYQVDSLLDDWKDENKDKFNKIPKDAYPYIIDRVRSNANSIRDLDDVDYEVDKGLEDYYTENQPEDPLAHIYDDDEDDYEAGPDDAEGFGMARTDHDNPFN